MRSWALLTPLPVTFYWMSLQESVLWSPSTLTWLLGLIKLLQELRKTCAICRLVEADQTTVFTIDRVKLRALLNCNHHPHCLGTSIVMPSFTLNDLLMNIHALFKHNYAGTYIQHPHKVNRVLPQFPVAFVRIVLVPSSLLHISHVPVPWRSKWPHLETVSY